MQPCLPDRQPLAELHELRVAYKVGRFGLPQKVDVEIRGHRQRAGGAMRLRRIVADAEDIIAGRLTGMLAAPAVRA